VSLIQPVEKQSVVDQLVATLKAAIIHGELATGALLPAERVLAEQVGVNRQAVREALQQLRQLGLVEIQQGQGATVLPWRDGAHFSVLYDSLFAPDGSVLFEHAADVLRMRAIAISDAARLAARHRTDEQLTVIEAHLAAMDAEPADAPVTPRFEIWDEIVEASGNIAYRLTYNSQMQIVRRLPDDVLATLSAGARMLDEYHHLVKALRARDADGAERWARAILGAVVVLLEGEL
jgi:DNA-binding FadR family transcriptional regulator